MKSVFRYLTREKFEWLLSDNGIYVGPANQQTDKSEGIYDASLILRDVAGKFEAIAKAQINDKQLNEIYYLLTNLGNSKRCSHFMSSWYLSENEDKEMWREYGANGVTILSNTELLSYYLPKPLEHAIEFVCPTYDDEKKAYDIHNPLHNKNNRYAHEREFRIIFNLTKYQILTGYGNEAGCAVRVGDMPSHLSSEINSCISELDRQNSTLVLHKKNHGYVLHYQLNSIIREIRLNPDATDAEFKYIVDLCKHRGLKCEVNHSELRI